MQLQCLVVDEQPQVVHQLEELIERNSSWAVVGAYVDPGKAVSYVQRHTVDLIFWDQGLPLASTVAVRTAITSNTKIIFTTQPAALQIAGLRSGVDSLCKPITLSRFLATRDRVQQFFQSGRAHLTEPSVALGDGFFYVKTGRTIKKLFWHTILYLESEKEYVRLVTTGEELLIYKRLKDLQQQLPPPFLRIHNSYIINAQWLDQIQDGQVFIGQQQIPIGEKFKEGFWTYINKRLL